MSKKIQVSASILCANFSQLGNQIKECEDAGVDMIHVDVMDGHFVPPITVGDLIVSAIRPLTKLQIEAHLMVEQPSSQIDSFLDAGADIIALHCECYGPLKAECRAFGQYPKEIESLDTDKLREDIRKIKKREKKVYIVVNPQTPLFIESLYSEIDGVLIMSVNPGFSGQKFMPMVLPKIQQLSSVFHGDISVDGGINELTAPEAVKAGANVLATASYFFGAEKPKEIVKYLKGLKGSLD